jgi:hypothetical protein
MNSQLTFILSMSCCMPLIAYLFLYKRVDRLFHPLMLVFLLGFIAEVSTRLNRLYFHIPGYTYYFYTTATIIFLFFYFRFYRNIGLVKNRNLISAILLAYIFFIFFNWVVIYHKDGFFNFFSIIIVYAVIILFFSVELFSKQIFNKSRNIIYNPFFWIGMAGIIFHIFFIYVSALILFKTSDGFFMNKVSDVQKLSNVFCYILYTIAILCIPKTSNYIKSF